MSRVIELRLKRLEAQKHASGYSDLTDDELQIAIYQISLSVMQHPGMEERDVEAAAAAIAEVRGDIVTTARRLLDPDYQEWLKRCFPASHVPAVTGGTLANGMNEYADQHSPRVMERRMALSLRSGSVVQSILKEAPLAALN
jgi:hypothetical protein